MIVSLQWYQWLALAALGICLINCLLAFLRLIHLGKPNDLSRPAGKTDGAIRYAFTNAMSPAKKESAYLHLPTYTAGLFYHMGNFLSFFLFIFIFFDLFPQGWLAVVIIIFLSISSISGISILLKRIIRKELRSLSNPDDFISNILVSLFQIATLIILLTFSLTALPSYLPIILPSYYIIFILLALYIPVGKLRHTVYFFAARYHLGYFFGWRGVWPPGKVKS